MMSTDENFNQNFTEKEHYVPQCYLKRFSIHKADDYFAYCLFKDSLSPKCVNIKKICMVKDLYEFKLVDKYFDRNVIEKRFVDMEGEYSFLCNRIHAIVKDQNEIYLSATSLMTLKKFIALLVYRNKKAIDIFSRELIQHIQNGKFDHGKFREVLKSVDDETYNKEFKAFFEESTALAITHHFLIELLNPNKPSIILTAFMESMGANYCFLYDNYARFVTSNVPVINMHGVLGNFNDCSGIICLPLSPNLCVAFFDGNMGYHQKILKMSNVEVRKINNYHLPPRTDIIISNNSKNIEDMVGNDR